MPSGLLLVWQRQDSSVTSKTALGFRIKSGWAAVVVMSGPSPSPTVLHARRVDLSDPTVPESRQPYHALDETQGELERDENRIEARLKVIRHVTTQSVAKLLTDCWTNGWTPQRAGLVTGSLIDPVTIRHPHIRAHAMEGHLFRTVVENALRAHELPCVVLVEKNAFPSASKVIRRREADLRRTLANLRSHVEGPWRTEERLAALAAWVAISEK